VGRDRINPIRKWENTPQLGIKYLFQSRSRNLGKLFPLPAASTSEEICKIDAFNFLDESLTYMTNILFLIIPSYTHLSMTNLIVLLDKLLMMEEALRWLRPYKT
jgi:hypothetical protein